MNYIEIIKKSTIFSLCIFLLVGSLQSTKSSELQGSKKGVPMKLSIIVGSNRATSTGKQIANNVVHILKDRSDVTTEVLYVGDYNLPFYTDAASPASLKEYAVNPIFKKWSKDIADSAAFIIIAPVYNAGYPAPLKNALDALYKEWNHKPVGVVGYSGGPSGGESMIAQLKEVFEELKMISVATSIKIPYSWKAFNQDGDLVEIDRVAKELHLMVNELISAQK